MCASLSSLSHIAKEPCDSLEGWEIGGRLKRKGTHVYLWLIHVEIWQRPTQYCKAIIFQLKIKKLKYILKKKKVYMYMDQLAKGNIGQKKQVAYILYETIYRNVLNMHMYICIYVYLLI